MKQLLFFSQNGCQGPFWMTKNHFQFDFSPFQINTKHLFFSKWPPAAILEVRFGPFWMTKNRFWSHFSPFQINTQYFFLDFFSIWPPAAILDVRFVPRTIGFFHYVLSMDMPNMKLIGEFMTQLEAPQAFWEFLYKMAARGHFVFPIDAKNHKVLVIWDLNGYMNLIGVFVTKLWPVQALACGGATKNIIPPNFQILGI